MRMTRIRLPLRLVFSTRRRRPRPRCHCRRVRLPLCNVLGGFALLTRTGGRSAQMPRRNEFDSPTMCTQAELKNAGKTWFEWKVGV